MVTSLKKILIQTPVDLVQFKKFCSFAWYQYPIPCYFVPNSCDIKAKFCTFLAELSVILYNYIYFI